MPFSYLATDAIFQGHCRRDKTTSQKLPSGRLSIIKCAVISLPRRQLIISRWAAQKDEYANDCENSDNPNRNNRVGNHIASYKTLLRL